VILLGLYFILLPLHLIITVDFLDLIWLDILLIVVRKVQSGLVDVLSFGVDCFDELLQVVFGDGLVEFVFELGQD
jgi:hypothetical protein